MVLFSNKQNKYGKDLWSFPFHCSKSPHFSVEKILSADFKTSNWFPNVLRATDGQGSGGRPGDPAVR